MSAKRPKQHSSSLRTYVDGYVHYLASQGYKESTRGHYQNDLLKFIACAERSGIYSPRRLCTYADSLLPKCSDSKWSRRGIRSTVNRFIEYLVQCNVVIIPKTNRPKTRYAQVTYEFTQFQAEHRGVCSEYAKAITSYCTCFFKYLQSRDIRRLPALTPEVLLDFITEEGKKYVRRTMSSRCSTLRTLITYLHRRGLIRHNLTGVVIGPRVYRDEACPRFISRSQMQAILSQIDRTTSAGLRDYAMILLLTTYGLRGIEVIRLRLDDVDWANNVLHIKARKAGNNTDYPLASSVAKALIQYLKKTRPRSSHRHLFLSLKVPYGPLACTWALGDRIRQYMKAAGIQVARPGAHTFRYSCAQSLLKRGTPLKVISDYLGHIEPGTTQQYIKIAIDDLRGVALGDGEEVAL